MRVMDFAERMRQAREAAGYKPQQVIYETRKHLSPPDYFEVDVIRRIERGQTSEHKVKPAVFQALAKVYDRDERDLSEVAAENVAILRGALVKNRWLGTTPPLTCPAAA